MSHHLHATVLPLILCISFITACSSGGSSSESPSSGGAVIEGQAIKGPMKAGAFVTITQLGGPGQVGGMIVDDTGRYSVSVPWSGPTRIEAHGGFTDEFTGGPSTTETTLLAAVDVAPGQTTHADLTFTSTVVALLNDRYLETHGSASADYLHNSEGMVASQIQNLLESPSTLPAISSIPLLSGQSSADLLLAFHLAVAAALPSNTTPEAVARQFATNLSNNQPFGSPDQQGNIVVTRDALVERLIALKQFRPLTVAGTGQTLRTDQLLSNLLRAGAGNISETQLNDFVTNFMQVLSSTLASSGAPQLLCTAQNPCPPRLYIHHSCAWGGEVVAPPKVSRGSTALIDVKVTACNGGPPGTASTFDMSIGTNPACPAGDTCVLSQHSVMVQSAAPQPDCVFPSPSNGCVRIQLSVAIPTNAPLGYHSIEVKGSDAATGWQDSHVYTVQVVENAGATAWNVQGTGSFFDIVATNQFSFVFPDSASQVFIPIGNNVVLNARYTSQSSTQRALTFSTAGVDAESECTYTATGSGPIISTSDRQTASGSITGSLSCWFGDSAIGGSFTARGEPM